MFLIFKTTLHHFRRSVDNLLIDFKRIEFIDDIFKKRRMEDDVN